MNKTKRKIFETSMKLFAEKGYEATSIEEITAVVGVAKGTLYYHFSSKEEIFNFLVEEGMKLLKNSIEIKIQKCDTTVEKLKAVSSTLRKLNVAGIVKEKDGEYSLNGNYNDSETVMQGHIPNQFFRTTKEIIYANTLIALFFLLNN